jgi:hypothetical protein
MGSKPKCVRCESLERKQKSRKIHYLKISEEESIPLCSVCILEIQDEKDLIESLKLEENESGSEEID